MAWYRCGGGGLPAGLQSDMDTVLNKKFSTSTTYPPNTWPDNVNLLGPLPEKTASGAISNITDGADGVPIKNWLVTLPASLDGYTEVNGTKIASNNLMSFPEVDFTYKNVRYYTVDGILYLDGTSTGETSPAVDEFKALSFYLKAGTYYFNRGSLALPSYIYKKSDGTQLRVNNGSFTLAEDTECNFGFYIYNKSFSNSKADLCLNIGSTAITYEDTTAPTQYTASLGRTIYGGTADIVTGEGSADGAIVTLDDTMSYGINLGTDTNRIAVSFYNSVGKINGTFASNDLTVGENTTGGYKSDAWVVWGSTSAARMWISVPTSIDTVDKFKQYVQNNTITIAYELSTATAFTFTPITPTPETVLGVNNFWADEGDSDVTYRADISLALQALGGGGRGLMMMRPTEPEETEETEETEGLEDELNR